MTTFMGFWSDKKTQVLFDAELVKRDLLNQFDTPKGSRLMNASYGFIGHELLFEHMINSNKQLIIDDAVRIINSDPRVSLISYSVDELDYGYQLKFLLNYMDSSTPFELLYNLQSKMS